MRDRITSTDQFMIGKPVTRAGTHAFCPTVKTSQRHGSARGGGSGVMAVGAGRNGDLRLSPDRTG